MKWQYYRLLGSHTAKYGYENITCMIVSATWSRGEYLREAAS